MAGPSTETVFREEKFSPGREGPPSTCKPKVAILLEPPEWCGFPRLLQLHMERVQSCIYASDKEAGKKLVPTQVHTASIHESLCCSKTQETTP